MVATSRQLSSLVEAIEQYIRHEIPLVELRGVLSDAIQSQPAYADTIHAVLDDKLENRHLTFADYGELIVGMGEILSEDIPMDCSDTKPDTRQDSVTELATPVVDVAVTKVLEPTVQEPLNQKKEPGIVLSQPSRAKQLRRNISLARNSFVFKFMSSRTSIAVSISLVGVLVALITISFVEDAPDGVQEMARANEIAVTELNATAESIFVIPTANSMLVLPSTESILIVEWQPERAAKQGSRSAAATKPKVKARPVRQSPTRAVRHLPAPQPEAVTRSARNTELERDSGAFKVMPKPTAAGASTVGPVSFLTEVRGRFIGVDATENIVTIVNTSPVPSNVEQTFVKNVESSTASNNLDQVVYTVSSSVIDLVGVVMTVRGSSVDEP